VGQTLAAWPSGRGVSGGVVLSHRRKLIEVALPLEAINQACKPETENPFLKNHPRSLHVWWARTPLVACRAVLFASIVDDPSSLPEKFPTEEDQERERQRLFRLIEELVKWESTGNEAILEAARSEIQSAMDGRQLSVIDPFCGRGSIPLEAQRLGLDVYASDLNPIAALITKALVETPPKFAGRPPVNPEAREKFTYGGTWKGPYGLIDDVRYYGRWMRDEASKRVGYLYPKAKLPNGGRATVIAWLWARTVRSPNPVFAHVAVPLIASFILSNKAGKEAYVEPIIEGDHYRFDVKVGKPQDIEAAKKGTRAGKAQDFLCLLSGVPIPRSYIREEGKAGRLGTRLMAIVADSDRRRFYLPPAPSDEAGVVGAIDHDLVETARSTFLSGATPTRAMITGGVCSAYGLSTWGHLFTPRQIAALTALSDLVSEAREQVLSDGADGHYADAIATYLAFALNRLIDYSNALATWNQSNENVRNLFQRQAIPMAWDFAEANVIEGDLNIETAAGWVAGGLTYAPSQGLGTVRQLDATSAQLADGPGIVCTDPPYYDNISYAELSDFFYVWLRRSIGALYPDLFSTLLTPKAQELIAGSHRFGGDDEAAEKHFEAGFRSAFTELGRISDEVLPMTVYYAYKQSEDELPGLPGVISTGWEKMLEGLINSGLQVMGTWPMRTTKKARSVARGTNALASSIVLACRPRASGAGLATRREYIAELREELPSALRRLQHGNVAPVDLAQAAIGPGMAIFSRYAKVVEADASPMTVRTALGLINQVLDEILAEQEGDFDADTRFAVTWFEQRGSREGPYGEADVLARAKNTSVTGMEAAGILRARAGKVRLLNRGELSSQWDPIQDRRLTVWEVTQHLKKFAPSDDRIGAVLAGWRDETNRLPPQRPRAA
jgi:putative DNA methylase